MRPDLSPFGLSGRLKRGAIATALVVLSASCGSRLSHDAFVAAERGPRAGATRAGNDAGPAPEGSVSTPGADPTMTKSVGDTRAGDHRGPSTSLANGEATSHSTGGVKAPIRIGQVSSLSGPVGSNLCVPALKAVQAWVAEINAKGGVSGHPIEFTVADDGNDPSRHRALIQQMVEQNHVIAFLLNCAPLSGASTVSYIQQKQIPVIGVEGGSEWANENSMYFAQLPNGYLQGVAFSGSLATAAVAEGKKRIALIICTESPACKTSSPNKAQVERFGGQVVYSAEVSLAQPDFTAQCLSARDARADVVMVGLDVGSVMRFADSCSNVSYKPIFGSDIQATSDDFFRNPSLDGMIINSHVAPWFLDAIPGIAAMRSAMGRYAPGTPVLPSSVVGWSAAKLFERAASRLPDRPTSADILAGLWSIQGDDLDGITTPLTFERGSKGNSTHTQPCWWTVRIERGKWIVSGDGKRRCS